MPEGNVELQRRAVEAFHARDVEAFIACLDPSVEYHSVMTVPGGAVYHGHDGVRQYFQDFKDAWGDEFSVEPEALFDLGEHTLMFYSVHGHGQQSGVQVAMPGAQVCRWRDGLMVYGKAYVHREDALRDLGVSEDTLEPVDRKASLAEGRVATRLPAQDLERARRFYAETLGLEPVEERPGGLRYRCRDSEFVVFQSTGAASGDHTQMAWEVDDIEATMRELRERGVVFEEYDFPGLQTVDGIVEVEGNYPSKGTGERGAWFRDSEGNLLGIGQPVTK